MRRATAALAGLAVVVACAPRIEGPGPQVQVPALGAEGFVTADGARLPVRRWLPDGPPKAIIVAVHGFNDYGNFFDEPGHFFADHGIASYAYDQRGFGQTPSRGLWPGTRTLADDLGAVTAGVRARHPGVPLFVVGESMGAAVATVALTDPQPLLVDGAVLAAPAVWGRATMPFYQRWALALASHTVPWLKVTARGLRVQASDNIEMLLRLSRDPLVIKETRIDALHGLTDLMDEALVSAERLHGRVLLLFGRSDEVIPAKSFRLLARRLPAEGRPRIAYYDSGWHMLLRDLGRETVWRDILAWMADREALLPSAADARAVELERDE